MKKVGVLLAGSGVYDGSEIHEAVFTLYSLADLGMQAVCMAPDRPQHHVVNHTNGEEMAETRNVLIESARIARGEISALSDVNVSDLEALVIPGGFGAAKNLNQWAIAGPEGEIIPEVRDLIRAFIDAGKPIVGLCMGPTVISKALEGTGHQVSLTVGSSEEPSPYDIKGISEGMTSIGSKVEMKTIREIMVDEKNKIITAPCYMMEASIVEVAKNVRMAIEVLKEKLA